MGKLDTIEIIVDKMIPVVLLLLLAIIIIDLRYPETAEKYHTRIIIGDLFITSVFMADLAFKYRRVENPKQFIKQYWLEILAVFPFFLVFRVFERFIGLFSRSMAEARTVGEGLSEVQSMVHGGLKVESEAVRVASGIEKEGAMATKAVASRAERFGNFLKKIFNGPKYIRTAAFFDEPRGKGLKTSVAITNP